MAIIGTDITDVQVLIQKFWSQIFVDKLKEDTILPSLVSKDYQGEIKDQGDTVKVSAIDRPTASTKTVGDAGYENYDATKMTFTQIEVKADTIIQAGYKLESIAHLQSQLMSKDSKIRQGLFEALEIALNDFLYSKVAPTVATPGVSDFNATELGNLRIAASQNHWNKNERWLIADPVYFQDLLNATTMTSGDFGSADTPTIGGQFVLKRFGFNIVEDNSAGMAQVSPTAAVSDLALSFIPDFMYFVAQRGVTFKLSDLHPTGERGFLLTAEMLVGASLGIQGADKHQTVYNA